MNRIETLKDAVSNANMSPEDIKSAFIFNLSIKLYDNHQVFPDLCQARRYIIDNHLLDLNVFRGQTHDWPLVSAHWRKNDIDRAESSQRTLKFIERIINNQNFKSYYTPPYKAIGIAQHYSYEHNVSTHFLDFSYALDIASFFATDGEVEDGDVGVIVIANIPTMKLQYAYMGLEGCHMFDMPGLWRLEKQEGLFLADINGDFEKYAPIIKLKFRQQKGFVSSTQTINRTFVYPDPNRLEREINRYFNIALRSRPLNQIVSDIQNIEVIKVDKDPIAVDAENIVSWASWPIEKTNVWRNFVVKKYNDITFSDEVAVTIKIDTEFVVPSKNEARQIRELLGLMKKTESTPYIPKVRLVSAVPDALNVSTENMNALFSHFLKEYCISYCALPLDDYDKIISIKSLALFAIYESDKMPNILGGHKGLQTFCRTFQTGDVVYCDIEDDQGVVSAAYLSDEFLDNCKKLTGARQEFNAYFHGRCDFLDKAGKRKPTHLERNGQVFQFISNVKQLFVFSELVTIWAFFVIPWQIAFRSNKHVVINPVFVEKIGLA